MTAPNAPIALDLVRDVFGRTTSANETDVVIWRRSGKNVALWRQAPRKEVA
jgi:hypothetical protein